MSKEQAVDELVTALDHPDAFRGLVDALEPSAVRTCLQLWGIYHRVYPPPSTPLQPPRPEEIEACIVRMKVRGNDS